jgi:hypothetical protein
MGKYMCVFILLLECVSRSALFTHSLRSVKVTAADRLTEACSQSCGFQCNTRIVYAMRAVFMFVPMQVQSDVGADDVGP